MFLPLPLEQQATFSLGEGGRDCAADGRGEIYRARQSLGMQARDRQDCFHIIVPSSSSHRFAVVCTVCVLFLYSSVCIFVC